MKFLFAIVAIILMFNCVPQKETFYGTLDLNKFREGRNSEMRDKEKSPLKEEDFEKFSGLKYYPTEDKYRVTANFTRTADEDYFQMPTSSGKEKKFIKFGVLKFRIDERDCSLNAYQFDKEVLKTMPEYAEKLFIPFKDLTSNQETYGGGRYIDIQVPGGELAILDFNLAYNPSCAFGTDRYNCPIPPAENNLKIEIKAGELSYLPSYGRKSEY